jgi:hypothetical protein
VPVPIAKRLVVIPVLPSVTVSDAVNLRGKAGRAEAVHPREPIHAAPTPQVAPMMKSLRFMTPPHCCGQHSIEVYFIQMPSSVGRAGLGFGYQSLAVMVWLSRGFETTLPLQTTLTPRPGKFKPNLSAK